MEENNYWVCNLFYANRNDERLIVPKKIGVGWTINFCHPKANLCLFITMMVILFSFFAFTICMNYSYLQSNSNIIFWYLLSIISSLAVFSLILLKFKLNIKDIYVSMSYGILACFIGFGLQQIFNGIPILIIKMENVKWYYHIYFGAMAGVCQSFGKFVVILLLMKLCEKKNTILKLGLLVGLGFTISEISVITLTMIFKKVSFSLSYLSVFERTSASIFHIYTGGLIAIGLIKQTNKYLVSVILIHWVLDFMAGAYQHFKISVYLLEIIFFTISIFVFAIYVFCLQNTVLKRLEFE